MTWKITGTSHPSVVTDGLVLNLDAANQSSYPGSGTTWTDLSGNGNNGTLVSGVGFDSGNQGSLTFNGVNEYVNLGDILDVGSGDYTFQVWSRLTSTDSQFKMIMDKRAGSGTDRIVLLSRDNNGFIQATIGDGSQSFNALDTISHRDGIWRNHAFTVNRSNSLLTLYRDGVSISSTNITGLGTQDNGRSLVLAAGYGSSGLDASYYWKGNIAQVSIYNRALTAAEILQNYNALKGRFGL